MSLGLVAYGSSGESDSEEENEVSTTTGSRPGGRGSDMTQPGSPCSTTNRKTANENKSDTSPLLKLTNKKDSLIKNEVKTREMPQSSDDPVLSGQIEDDEYDILPTATSSMGMGAGALKLPPPKHIEEDVTQPSSTSSAEPTSNPLAGLPPPKPASAVSSVADIKEDELEEEVKPKAYGNGEAEKPPGKSRPEKRTVQITVPALPQDDGDGPAGKKPKLASASGGKSGLFSLLPAPKHEATKVLNRSLIPDSVSKKPAAKLPQRPAVPGSGNIQKKAASSTTASALPHRLVDTADSDEEEEEDTPNFFSLGGSGRTVKAAASSVQPNIAPSAEPPPPAFSPSDSSDSQTTVSSSVSQENTVVESSSGEEAGMQPVIDMDAPLMFGRSNTQRQMPYKPVPAAMRGAEPGPGAKAPPEEEEGESERVFAYPQYDEQLASVSSYASADDVETFAQDDQFLRLQGKKQRGKEAIEIIDVNQDDQMSKVDLMKHMTEETESASYSRKKKDMPTAQQRRKHQITQLAYLAKERELTLKNQWAQNRQTRKQTQSKYGF